VKFATAQTPLGGVLVTASNVGVCSIRWATGSRHAG